MPFVEDAGEEVAEVCAVEAVVYVAVPGGFQEVGEFCVGVSF